MWPAWPQLQQPVVGNLTRSCLEKNQKNTRESIARFAQITLLLLNSLIVFLPVKSYGTDLIHCFYPVPPSCGRDRDRITREAADRKNFEQANLQEFP